MLRRSLLFSVCVFVLLALSLAGCVSSLSRGRPQPTPTRALSKAEPTVASTPTAATVAEIPTPTASGPNTVTLPLVTTGEGAAVAAPTPAPTVVSINPETIRDQALAFVRGAYLLALPADASFVATPIDPTVAATPLAASYASGPWQVHIGAPYDVGGRLVSPAILIKTGSDTRWWGEVGADGLITTVVAARMPSPASRRANGWVGRIVKLPTGSPYDDYFEDAQGNRYGVASNRANVQTMLASLTAYKGQVRVSGEVRFAAPDYNGRRLLVRQIDLLDAPPVDAAEPTAPLPGAAESPPPVAGVGPIGALSQPTPQSVVATSVRVAGHAEGLFENKVIVRVEAEDGTVLGEVIAITDAAAEGQNGSFSVDAPFQNPATTSKGRVAIYGENPTDGSLILLAWVNTLFAGSTAGKGVTISEPQEGERVKGMTVVRGTAIGLDGTMLLVRVEDAAGIVFGQARTQVNAPAAQAPAEWQVKLPISRPRTVRSGRIAVYELRAGDDSMTLLAAHAVQLVK